MRGQGGRCDRVRLLLHVFYIFMHGVPFMSLKRQGRTDGHDGRFGRLDPYLLQTVRKIIPEPRPRIT